MLKISLSITDCAENIVPLLLITGHYLATAVVFFLISRPLPSDESTCHNIHATTVRTVLELH
jgi:hypothetical protein